MKMTQSIHSPITRAALLLMALALLATSPVTMALAPSPNGILFYGDVDRFATALAEIDAGAPPEAALQRYISEASPGMQIFTSRFGTSAESIADKLASHPKYYRYLSTLRPDLEAREAELMGAIGQLQSDAPPGSRPVPIYFLVANLRAGGNPGMVQTPEGPRPAIAIAIDVMAMSERVDLAEFPKQFPGVLLADVPKVALHEMVHIFQMQAQGPDNYRSLYTDPTRMTNLAFAIREGCAEFLAWRASGWRFEDRHRYVTDNADALWKEFSPLLHEPVDQAASWFGPRSEAQPDRPMQVGYGIGEQICAAYHEAATDKARALDRIYGAYLPEHFEEILAPYAERMAR